MSDEKQQDFRPKLSVLLATVTARADLFALLHAHLSKQAEGKPVELVVACDNKEISIGKKRDNLLKEAKGDYVCFVDDDDWCADTYIDDILEAIATDPDCVGFEIHCTQNGRNPRRAITSMRYREWGSNIDGYHYVRSIYHKSPVKRELALQVGFKDLRYAEDKLFSNGIMQLVKTEVFIKKVLYYYRFRSEPFMIKYGFAKGRTMPPAGVPAPRVPRQPKYDYKGRRVG